MINDIIAWGAAKWQASKQFGIDVIADITQNNIMEWAASSWAALLGVGVLVLMGVAKG
ncbi:hypothetical protein [Ensifer adhaerens]|uniref:hypothetical protein n=1 Tax=Ensifer adhaerens TaxID=106592 RepID=UPI000DC5860A|nr:hypothetical protein [Ensifer adhaerens]RAS16090.1 hypothetical protein DEU52_10220 [Ensifer adhaerens]